MTFLKISLNLRLTIWVELHNWHDEDWKYSYYKFEFTTTSSNLWSKSNQTNKTDFTVKTLFISVVFSQMFVTKKVNM